MSHRRMTPKGQMSSNGSGPAIMMMKPHIRATFMPDPPLRFVPLPKKGGTSRRSNFNGKATPTNPTNPTTATDESGTTDLLSDTAPFSKTSSLQGVSNAMIQFQRSKPLKRSIGTTPKSAKRDKDKQAQETNTAKLAPLIDQYQNEQKKCGGEFDGMNCYNTLFVGRLAYETTERKLLRELETFGPVKDLKLILKQAAEENSSSNNNNNSKNDMSRGYAFVEFENEEDMKRAYRGADGMRLDGREIVVDVERGHTVPNWLPRRLGGGLGGSRLGGKDKNITAPGRFDPSKQSPNPPPSFHHPGNHPNNNHHHHNNYPPNHHPMHNMNHPNNNPPPYGNHPHPMHRGGPPPSYGNGGHGGGYGGGPPGGGHRGGPPPPHWDRRDGPPPHWRGGRSGGGGGGGGDRGGPPPGRYGPGNGGPPPSDRYGGGDRDRDRDRGGGGRYPPGPSERDRYGGGGRYDRKRPHDSRSGSPPSRRRFR